ncbi:hypothetical protein Ccrd_003276 [Cynara cardunculus var. scolymus]|uniref:Uncharacterized protein n=1 Tax=Cynara cardunculus var. scolymus TaxID=59895 RepID=A0A103XPT5_CYNCS|nr:hypothetical protein Ccrd_003276 [Cynara cardunculus var. scolymus]
MVQVRLVSNHHDDNIGVCVVSQLTQPPLDIVEGLPFGYIIYEKGPNRTSIVCTGYRSVPLLSGCVPNLSLYGLSIYLVLVANSTPMVDLDSRQNSFLVNLDRILDFPTPESPINTILNK